MLMHVAHSLDLARGKLLRFTLPQPVLREIFFERSTRLAVLFSFAAFIALLVSLFFPLWVLVIGPILYGFPHLISSLRYFSYFIAGPDRTAATIKKRQLFLGCLTGAYALLATLRVLEDLNGGQGTYLPQAFLSVEVTLTVFLTATGLWLSRAALGNWFRAGLLVAPLLLLAWFVPLWLAGAMTLLHNAIAFIYWLAVCKTPRERRVAWLAFAAFGLITAGIFVGTFEPLYKLMTPAFELPWADLVYWDIGKQIFPVEESYSLWFRCVVAYAFGQSLHYFVWLKAIPDQCHDKTIPTTFQAGLHLLKQDYGRYFFLVVAFVAGGLGVWLLTKHPAARVIYFAFAAYHGYVELAGLAVVTLRKAV